MFLCLLWPVARTSDFTGDESRGHVAIQGIKAILIANIKALVSPV
jgi:hypothetical protein